MTRDNLIDILSRFVEGEFEEEDLSDLLGAAARAEEFGFDSTNALYSAIQARVLASRMNSFCHIADTPSPEAVTTILNTAYTISLSMNDLLDALSDDTSLNPSTQRAIDNINLAHFPHHMALKIVSLRRIIDETEHAIASGKFDDSLNTRAEAESTLIEMNNKFIDITGLTPSDFDESNGLSDEEQVSNFRVV